MTVSKDYSYQGGGGRMVGLGGFTMSSLPMGFTSARQSIFFSKRHKLVKPTFGLFPMKTNYGILQTSLNLSLLRVCSIKIDLIFQKFSLEAKSKNVNIVKLMLS